MVISIFHDYQTFMNNLRVDHSFAGPVLKMQIYQKAEWLVRQGHDISIRWILTQSRIKRNERADRADKEVASRKKSTNSQMD